MTRERKSWIPELDGLRALMVFVVSAYHIWQQSWLTPAPFGYSLDPLLRSGYTWVDGTVLLSGFLLFLPYAKARRAGGPLPDTAGFYFRRARKILPGYYFILALVFFAVALPWRLYDSPQFMVKDLATHLTFTFSFFFDTYQMTPLGTACWTLAIEVQAYLLFPFLARAALRRPRATTGVLLGLCFGFRLWCIWSLSDFSMVVNQLINMLDLYVLGALAAWVFTDLEERRAAESLPRGSAALATALFLAAFAGLMAMLRVMAASSVYSMHEGFAGWVGDLLGMARPASGYPVIQRNQMLYRPVFGLLFGALILSAPFSLRPLRKLLGNPVSRFLADISLNYYLIHQTVIVHMRRLGFPPSASLFPNQAGEQPWQTQYTLLAYALSFALAVVITWAVEKPIQRLLDRRRATSAAADAQRV